MASQIYLIRHGETPSNATGVVQTPETPLSKRGRKQAIALGRRLAQQDVTAILSSDLERAHETARAGQDVHPVHLSTGSTNVANASIEANVDWEKGRYRLEIVEDMHQDALQAAPERMTALLLEHLAEHGR